MKRLFVLVFGCVVGVSALAQGVEEGLLEDLDAVVQRAEEVLKKEKPQLPIVPGIVLGEPIKLGNSFLFDASETVFLDLSRTPTYSWDFGDGSRVRYGQQVSHTFKSPGEYLVRLTVAQGGETAVLDEKMLVYERRGVLLSDNPESLKDIEQQAAANGVWLQKIIFEGEAVGLTVEEEYIRQLQERLDFIEQAEILIFATDSSIGLQHFSQLWGRLPQDKKFDLTNKLWVRVVNDGMDKNVRLTQPFFQILRPQFVLLTRPEALNPIFQNSNNKGIVDLLRGRGIEYRVIDERTGTSVLLPFSRLTTYFVTHGISQNVIYLLLVVPYLAFVVVFFRQVVGVATFGVYAPLMLALTFFFLGIYFSLAVFFVVLLVSYVIRMVFEKVELLYIPRVGLLLSALALSFFLVLGLAIYFETPINLSYAIFPMMVMATISEKFLSAQSEGGFRSAIVATGETLVVALLAFLLFEWSFFKDAILSLPELVLLPIFGNVWLGRFTGLRLTEYFKFRSLLHEDSQE